MSIQTQQQLAARLTVLMAVLVAASLALVGWTLYRPAATASTPSAAVAEH